MDNKNYGDTWKEKVEEDFIISDHSSDEEKETKKSTGTIGGKTHTTIILPPEEQTPNPLGPEPKTTKNLEEVKIEPNVSNKEFIEISNIALDTLEKKNVLEQGLTLVQLSETETIPPIIKIQISEDIIIEEKPIEKEVYVDPPNVPKKPFIELWNAIEKLVAKILETTDEKGKKHFKSNIQGISYDQWVALCNDQLVENIPDQLLKLWAFFGSKPGCYNGESFLALYTIGAFLKKMENSTPEETIKLVDKKNEDKLSLNDVKSRIKDVNNAPSYKIIDKFLIKFQTTIKNEKDLKQIVKDYEPEGEKFDITDVLDIIESGDKFEFDPNKEAEYDAACEILSNLYDNMELFMSKEDLVNLQKQNDDIDIKLNNLVNDIQNAENELTTIQNSFNDAIKSGYHATKIEQLKTDIQNKKIEITNKKEELTKFINSKPKLEIKREVDRIEATAKKIKDEVIRQTLLELVRSLREEILIEYGRGAGNNIPFGGLTAGVVEDVKKNIKKFGGKFPENLEKKK